MNTRISVILAVVVIFNAVPLTNSLNQPDKIDKVNKQQIVGFTGPLTKPPAIQSNNQNRSPSNQSHSIQTGKQENNKTISIYRSAGSKPGNSTALSKQSDKREENINENKEKEPFSSIVKNIKTNKIQNNPTNNKSSQEVALKNLKDNGNTAIIRGNSPSPKINSIVEANSKGNSKNVIVRKIRKIILPNKLNQGKLIDSGKGSKDIRTQTTNSKVPKSTANSSTRQKMTPKRNQNLKGSVVVNGIVNIVGKRGTGLLIPNPLAVKKTNPAWSPTTLQDNLKLALRNPYRIQNLPPEFYDRLSDIEDRWDDYDYEDENYDYSSSINGLINIVGNGGPGISNVNSQLPNGRSSRIVAGRGFSSNGRVNIVGNQGGGIVVSNGGVLSGLSSGDTFIQNVPGQGIIVNGRPQ